MTATGSACVRHGRGLSESTDAGGIMIDMEEVSPAALLDRLASLDPHAAASLSIRSIG